MHYAARNRKKYISHFLFEVFFRILLIDLKLIFSDYEKVAQLLIEKGYKNQVHIKDHSGYLPLNHAVRQGNFEILYKRFEPMIK